MKYKVIYRYESDNIGNIIEEGLIECPLEIRWFCGANEYKLESKIRFTSILDSEGGSKVIAINSEFDFIYKVYLSNKNLLVLYSNDLKDNKIFPPPNNLVLYNLEKEVMKIIPTPKSTNGLKMPITSMGSIKMIDGIKHISVRIDNTYFDGYGDVEIHYLNTNTFEYHPTFIEKHKEYGR